MAAAVFQFQANYECERAEFLSVFNGHRMGRCVCASLLICNNTIASELVLGKVYAAFQSLGSATDVGTVMQIGV